MNPPSVQTPPRPSGAEAARLLAGVEEAPHASGVKGLDCQQPLNLSIAAKGQFTRMPTRRARLGDRTHAAWVESAFSVPFATAGVRRRGRSPPPQIQRMDLGTTSLAPRPLIFSVNTTTKRHRQNGQYAHYVRYATPAC